MKTYLKFSCIYCGQHLECDPVLAGRQTMCPGCQHRIVIPSENGGSSAKPNPNEAFTWDTQVPTPMVETPTRHGGETPPNA